MKVSDYITQLFVEHNIKHVFSISGAGNVHLLNSILQTPELISIHPHQEQSGVIASIAYKRICGRLGVMITTSGGAATNAITGALDAWADSIPVLIISGQEKLEFVKIHQNLRMWGVQGFDIAKTVSNITKYSVLISDPKRVKYEFQKAIYTAETGRPGPVWIDIPTDVQAAQIEPNELESFVPELENVKPEFNGLINQVEDMLKTAERPVFIFGNGVRLSGSEHLLPLLVDKFKIPFMLAWNGVDMMPSDHPLNYGREGTYGQRCANYVVQNADLIITVGTRMAIPQIGYDYKEFGRDAKKVVVDIDRNELDKFANDSSFLLIEANAAKFLNEMVKSTKASETNINKWILTCNNWRSKYPFVEPNGMHKEQDGKLNSYAFIWELNKHFDKDEIIVCDMGTALTCTHQSIMLNGKQRMVTSTGLGEMGFGLPGAIGASLASDNGRVICINGDGSMMMNLQELQTIVQLNLPIKLFVYINDGYLTIKHTQNNLFGNKFAGSGKSSGVTCPDFEKVGKAFGFKTFKIHSLDEAKTIIPKVLKEDGPVLCEVFIHSFQLLAPKTSFNINPDGTLVSPPLEDLS
ncbi:MAG: thiamine pyrophosphate-binding protein, partial [Chitinophagaceae bacterium]|nr:thiamine pyrophosphate-binding protein [Chitinophagaceae bacterium]